MSHLLERDHTGSFCDAQENPHDRRIVHAFVWRGISNNHLVQLILGFYSLFKQLNLTPSEVHKILTLSPGEQVMIRQTRMTIPTGASIELAVCGYHRAKSPARPFLVRVYVVNTNKIQIICSAAVQRSGSRTFRRNMECIEGNEHCLSNGPGYTRDTLQKLSGQHHGLRILLFLNILSISNGRHQWESEPLEPVINKTRWSWTRRRSGHRSGGVSFRLRIVKEDRQSQIWAISTKPAVAKMNIVVELSGGEIMRQSSARRFTLNGKERPETVFIEFSK